jgi:glycerol-1-phosphate dehydrogenase [NAD(P)+]
MLDGGPPQWHPAPITCAELEGRFGTEIGESCWREFEAKRLTPDREAGLAQRAADAWDDIRNRVRSALIPAATIATILERAGCPTTPAQIGLAPGFYATAVRNARFLRDRYTFLDLADDSGRLAMLWPTERHRCGGPARVP